MSKNKEPESTDVSRTYLGARHSKKFIVDPSEKDIFIVIYYNANDDYIRTIGGVFKKEKDATKKMRQLKKENEDHMIKVEVWQLE